MRKLIVGAVAAAALAGASVAVAVTNPLGIAGAQNDPGTTAAPTTQAPTTTAPAPPSTGEGQGQGPGTGHHGHGPKGGFPGGRGGPEVLEQTLQELVANGTITQAQADAIIAALKAKIGAGGPGGPGMDAMKEGVLQAAADTIGIDLQALIGELKAGKSIAEVAQAHGVDPQKVIDAITAKITAKIDEGVAAGKIPADRAAKMKAELAQHIADMVNGKHGPGHHGPHPGGPGDAGGHEPTPPTSAPAPTTPDTTSPTTAPAPTTTAATTPPGTI